MNESARPWLTRLHSSTPGCGAYRTILDEVVRGAPENDGDLPLLRALAEVAAMTLDPEDPQRPLRGMFPGASREVADLDPATLDLLKSVASEMPSDLRARIRDVLWIVRRGAEIDGARAMVDDYCAAAEPKLSLAPTRPAGTPREHASAAVSPWRAA